MAERTVSKVTDFLPDEKNANRGTERGRFLLEKSLRELGAGRSILADKNGKLIAGNKTAEVAAEIGMEDAIIVERIFKNRVVGSSLVLSYQWHCPLACFTKHPL